MIMGVAIKKGAPPSVIKKAPKTIEDERATRKGLDAKKYEGKIKFPVDGLTYQKQVRDEW